MNCAAERAALELELQPIPDDADGDGTWTAFRERVKRAAQEELRK